MTDWIRFYHKLPYFLRVTAASVRGYYLYNLRYNSKTQFYIDQYLEREQWSENQWETWRAERLAYILHRAATQVPYYIELWSVRRRAGDRASWEYLENWSVLKKEILRASPHRFVAEDCDIRQMFADHTSGTSGKPLTVWLSRETVLAWYALFETRVRGWNEVSRKDRWAILGGQLVTPVHQNQPPFWVWSQGLRQLYMSSYHLSPANIEHYLDALCRHNVTYLLGYASSLETLAKIAIEQGIAANPLRTVISNAEPLYKHQREVIEHVFRCPVRNTYGMSEIACAGSECECGSMHQWPEAGVLEIFEDQADVSVPDGQEGRFICTGLMNADMPLIRYEVGDRGGFSLEPELCKCSRTLPVLPGVEGRLDDVVLTRDGRRIGRLDPVFKADLPVREAQIIQESLDLIRIRFVPAPAFKQEDGEAVIRRLRDRVGEVEVVLEQVEDIPRTANGKFRAVISYLVSPQPNTTPPPYHGRSR